MTADRDVRAQSRVLSRDPGQSAPRAGGWPDGSAADSSRTHPGVDDVLTPLERILAAMIEDAIRWDRAEAARARLTTVERAS